MAHHKMPRKPVDAQSKTSQS